MTTADLPAVGKLAGKLVRLHYELDPLRFLHLANPEAGYAHYLGGELRNERAVLLVADDGDIAGYAYGRVEERSYNDLLDAHAMLHDVYVDESARRRGAGRALVLEVVRVLKEKGAPRVLLHTAVQNEAAQKLFQSLGFRTTMLEMTRESEGL